MSVVAAVAVVGTAACSSGGDEAGVTTDARSEDEVAADPTVVVDDATDAAEATGPSGFGLDLEPQEPVAWTYLVYSMADTNLEAPMLADVLEMASVGSSADVNVIALVDRSAEETDEPVANLDDWETAKLVYVEAGQLTEIADLGELDLADPDVLASFVEFGMSTFPAEKYALTISDHGGGWTGIGPDDSSGEVLDLAELAAGLDSGLANADGERIDLLGFDACLMATYEVASTLAPFADYMLASQELEPGHGWDYAALATLVGDPTMDPETLGTEFIRGYEGQAAAFEQDDAITLSLLDLSGMAALDESLEAFAASLSEQIDALGPIVGRELASNVSYGRSPDPEQSTHLTDLGRLVSEIGVESLQVSDQADAVLRAIGDLVRAQTVGPARLGSTGLSIYFPPTVDLIDTDYQEIPVVSTWNQFLSAYYQAGENIPPEAQPAVAGSEPETDGSEQDGDVVFAEATVEPDDDGVTVSVQVDPASLPNIVEASLSFGYVAEDGSIVQLGDTRADILDDGTIVGFTDLTVLTLTDSDGDTVDAYLSLDFSDDETLAFASVPLDYLAPDSDVWEPVDLSIVFDLESEEILEEIYYLIDEESGSYGELNADPDGLISPVVLVFPPDGAPEWQTFGDLALFADLPTLLYDFRQLDPGVELYVDITVTDFGGNQLIASSTFVR